MPGGTRSGVFFPLVLLASIANGQQTPADRRSIAPAGQSVAIEAREATASPAIQTQLAKLRQEIAAENLSVQVGHTAALDFPLERITGLKPPPDLEAAKHERFLERAGSSMHLLGPEAAGLCSPTAKSFDWRQVNGSTPVRDQGNCGTCWAFATQGSFEGSLRITSGIGADVNTSEQELLDCNPVGYSCEGGWWAFPMLLSTGTATEASYPYVAQGKTCKREAAQVFHGADWDYVTSTSVSDIKQALCQHGPLAVGVVATPRFQAYTGGVFKEAGAGKFVNHAVTLIGWNDVQRAWIIKNSWGPVWGETGGYGTERGYMRIAYGSNNIGSGAAWSQASTAIELETDTAWRSIAPLGNRAGTDLASVGAQWEMPIRAGIQPSRRSMIRMPRDGRTQCSTASASRLARISGLSGRTTHHARERMAPHPLTFARHSSSMPSRRWPGSPCWRMTTHRYTSTAHL